jgi:hypothetical protein
MARAQQKPPPRLQASDVPSLIAKLKSGNLLEKFAAMFDLTGVEPWPASASAVPGLVLSFGLPLKMDEVKSLKLITLFAPSGYNQLQSHKNHVHI